MPPILSRAGPLRKGVCLPLPVTAAAVSPTGPQPFGLPLPGVLHVAAAAPLALYLALVLATTFTIRLHTWLLTAAGVFATHVCYGVRFLQGRCARKAPCEFIGKDHAGEVKS